LAIILKKICMIGDFSVGKTSLVSRYVQQSFSDKYLTTVGVKIDTKLVTLPDQRQAKLSLWDIAGSDTLTSASMSYLRGAAGYLLVIDGTRRPTWDAALQLRDAVTKQIGAKPYILLLNKADLTEQWEVDDALVSQEREQGSTILKSSAKLGTGVEDAFTLLTLRMLDAN
jgi:small GTP-binding protein